MWREQALIEWSWHANSSVACCHSAKLCAYAARDFRSQQNGAVTRMWRLCGVQPSHKERAIGAVLCKKEGMLLQPLWWCCVDCLIHHERDVREEQHRRYMWREEAIIEWSWHVNCIVACCHSAKLCAYAARDFRSQHYRDATKQYVCHRPSNHLCCTNRPFTYALRKDMSTLSRRSKRTPFRKNVLNEKSRKSKLNRSTAVQDCTKFPTLITNVLTSVRRGALCHAPPSEPKN